MRGDRVQVQNTLGLCFVEYMAMHVSKYTFFIENRGRFYLYSTLSNSLLEVDEELYGYLRDSFLNRTEIPMDDIGGDSVGILRKRDFITDNDADNFLKYKSVIVRQRNQNSFMHLTVAPTMDCCFHCSYCFEKAKREGVMTEGVMDSIVRYVQHRTSLKSIFLTWFGGEPLMAVDQMEELYEKLSEGWSWDFRSNIVTTGYHLDDNAIRVLKKIKVSSMQVTLDGMRDTHNRVKRLPDNTDVFEKVMLNLENLCDKAPGISVVIRVNLTKENSDEYKELHDYCAGRFRGAANIVLAPAFVMDRNSGCASGRTGSLLFDRRAKSKLILNLWNQYGLDSPYIRYPQTSFHECAIRNDMAVSFDPEGYAYKCWEIIGDRRYAVARLDRNGCLTDINALNLNRQSYGADPLESNVCRECRYLPVCNGGCPIQRVENEFDGGHNDCCTYYKGCLEKFIKIHIDRKIPKNNV